MVIAPSGRDRSLVSLAVGVSTVALPRMAYASSTAVSGLYGTTVMTTVATLETTSELNMSGTV